MNTHARTSHRRPWLVLLWSTVGFGVVAWSLLTLLTTTRAPYPVVALDVLGWFDDRMERIANWPPQSHRVLFIGDSLAMDVRTRRVSVASQLQKRLTARAAVRTRSPIKVQPLTSSGFSLYSHYFVSDDVASLKPDQVILALNLMSFSEGWRSRERYQLSAFISPHRWLEALGLPLHEVGVTVDRLLFYRSIRAIGAFDAWWWLQREQARANRGYWRFAEWLQEWSGYPDGLGYRKEFQKLRFRRSRVFGDRATPSSARALLGAALDGVDPDHAGLQVLGAFLAHVREASIPVVVYVPPMNVEHLRSLGMYNEEGLGLTLKRIRTIVRGHGATFVDLHDVLADAEFTDFMDHLAADRAETSFGAVADLLSSHIQAPHTLPKAAR